MRTYKFTGYFTTGLKIEVDTLGFYTAFFLIMAKAINMGHDYNSLYKIEHEDGKGVEIREQFDPFKTPR